MKGGSAARMYSSSEDKPQSLSGPEFHPRGRKEAAIIYPVFSRRARGLSLGINLFPDRKQCTYRCPYCEVGPFSNPNARLESGMVESALREFFARDWPASYAGRYELKDISLSGNGEPTFSPFFEEALNAARRVLKDVEAAGTLPNTVPIVLITNSTGFLNTEIREMLERFSRSVRFEVWAKLDGGSPATHRILSGSEFEYGQITDAIAAFATRVPIKLQTMLCLDARNGELLFDADGYISTLRSLLQRGARIRAVQLYTVARRPAEPWILGVEDARMRACAASIRAALSRDIADIAIECYGQTGCLE